MLSRPTPDEHGSYYSLYIDKVTEGDLFAILVEQLKNTVALLSSLDDAQTDYRYAPGKWSVKEVLGHISETERIMCYRLLRVARGDQTPLAGFDEEAFVRTGCFHARSMTDLLEEFTSVRQATLTLLRGVPEEAWTRTGNVNNGVLSARALAYVLAGHEKHHVQVLQERYLSAQA
ncbi:DinB family protein [Brevibacillus reuszeri]|uniref:DinB family protein n=1 Tax=Brevibacillus reuszeri TaxID=54915 RepID=UPI000CCC2BBF|nr:DinB family protein [Brevibacillus reuszeri]